VRDLALVERLRSRSVDVNTPRKIDLQFLAPSLEAVRMLVDSLKTVHVGVETVGSLDGDTGQFSVTYTVHQSVRDVTARAAVEARLRLADAIGVVHDGWGTELN
jgi:regulator of ribonuclease activity B